MGQVKGKKQVECKGQRGQAERQNSEKQRHRKETSSDLDQLENKSRVECRPGGPLGAVLQSWSFNKGCQMDEFLIGFLPGEQIYILEISL